MKRKLTHCSLLLAWFWFAIAAPAQMLDHRRKAFRVVASSYLIEENFETTGVPSGWTETNIGGYFNYDDTSSPLQGSQSLSVTVPTGTSFRHISNTFAAPATTYVYFILNVVASPDTNNATAVSLVNGATTVMELNARTATGTWRLYHGTGFVSISGITVGTTFHFWLDYTKGTGANGAAYAYWATTGTKPGSPNASLTTGTATLDATGIRVGTNLNLDVKIDRVLVSNSVIGSNP